MAASCFLFFSAILDADSSAGSGEVATGDGAGATVGAGAGLSILGLPPKHIRLSFLCQIVIILITKKAQTHMRMDLCLQIYG
jgi:hypothetical protein